MTRVAGVVVTATVAIALGLAWLTRTGASGSTPTAVDTLAVLSAHVAYEGALADGVRSRLAPPDARVALAAQALTSALGAQLDAALRGDGESPAKARAIWASVIGDGAPPPSRVLGYVCSVHALESDHAELDAAPPAALAGLFGEIELTLALEGRQLAEHLGGPLGAAVDQAQRDLMHRIAPLLIATDRGFAAAA